MQEEDKQEIIGVCLRYLTRREHSQLELIHKLSDKGYSGESARSVISQLVEKGLQSDERFKESYARHRIRKGFGPVRINYELQQKGINECDLEFIVEELAGTWTDLLKEVYQKKYEGAGDLTRQEWAKRTRFLQQRGFSSEMIMNVFKELGVKIK